MLGLYIHIPFCVTKCKYCDFNSFKIDLNEKIKYLNYLGEEMKLYKEEIKNREIDSVFVGGGTPSILNENEINILFEKIKENFNIKSNAEITMECNPGTLTLNKLKVMKKSGVNRKPFRKHELLQKPASSTRKPCRYNLLSPYRKTLPDKGWKTTSQP